MMKIYPKKLHNLTDLEREKKRLKYAEKQSSLDDIFSLDGVLSGGKTTAKKGKKNSDNTSNISNKLSIARMVMDAMLAFGLPRGLRRAEKQKAAVEKPKKNMLLSAATQLVGGYLKWKAISLGLKGVSHLLKKSKDKKDK